MYKSWKLALLGIVLLLIISSIVLCTHAVPPRPNDTELLPHESNAPEGSTQEESAPNTELPEENPETNNTDLPTYIKHPAERPQENEPDIIKVNVRFYNSYSDGFNMDDGADYVHDIAALLRKYAPEGMRISAGCAMAYTEGGAGKLGVYSLTNNCFGIRAYSNWDGWVFARNTGKVYKDWETAMKYGATDCFRAYPTMEDSVKDYVALISSPYYNHSFAYDNDHDYLQYILSKGYGEEHLLEMWLALIKMYNMTQYNF